MSHVETKDAAKIMRKVLKGNFPGVKFSVRTNSYSMGSHVSISWTDGPREEAVKDLVSPYYSVGFNSMDDSTYYTETTMCNEDGTIEEVSFGGSSPSLSREMSDEECLEIGAELAKVATEAVYLVEPHEDREFTAEEVSAKDAWNLYLPVYVANLHFSDEEKYFAAHGSEKNAAACLIRSLHGTKTYGATPKKVKVA